MRIDMKYLPIFYCFLASAAAAHQIDCGFHDPNVTCDDLVIDRAENNPLDDAQIAPPVTLPKDPEEPNDKNIVITIDKKTCNELGGLLVIVGETENESYFSCVRHNIPLEGD